MKVANNKRPLWFDIMIFMAYMISYAIISYYHEPWFDEAQAWQIAKCASLKDILFEVPHYEGHPPLWHLILALPAKLGIPFEAGLKSIGLLISISYIYLLIFKSDFPRLIRYLLTWNFFLFYQFGVIVRPYGLLFLELLLLAICFSQRNKKPARFVGVMILLCLTHAYGLLISFGVALCWVSEIIQEKTLCSAFRSSVKDKREICLLILFVIALLVVVGIYPREDTFNSYADSVSPFWKRLVCMILIALPDCLFTHTACFNNGNSLLQYTNLSLIEYIPTIVAGTVLWSALYIFSSKKHFRYLYIPILLFSLFGSAVYMTTHHIGMCLQIVIFWLWIEMDPANSSVRRPAYERIKKAIETSKIIKPVLTVGLLCCLLVPIYWSISSSVNDIKGDYSYGRNLSAFMKKTGLDKALVFEAWEDYETSDNKDCMLPSGASELFAYFDSDLIANNCYKDSGQLYRHFKVVGQSDFETAYKCWRNIGVPDVIIGNPDIGEVYGSEVTNNDYRPVYLIETNYYFKDSVNSEYTYLLIRKDLLDQYGLAEIEISGLTHSMSLFNAEMIQRYKDGEITVDEIVDATLGDLGKQ